MRETDIKPIVLLVEDDQVTTMRISAGLRLNGFDVSTVGSLTDAKVAIRQRQPDLLVLDINLPDGSGHSLIQQARELGLGVLCISSAGELDDRITALKLGADDYIVKPVANSELAIKLNNLYDRLTPEMAQPQRESLVFAHYCCDLAAQEVVDQAGQVINLTPGEFDTLSIFLRHPRTALSRERLIQLLSTRDKSVNDRSIDIMVYKLRQKLEQNAKDPLLLKTVYGVGYLFDCQVTTTND